MVQAASTFRKSGFNDEDAATLAEVAATFQNVADTALSADDAAASIISQLRAYGETAEWATHVVDAYNAVANTQAVGTNDLATAMEVASAAMATYGNSFEQVLGLVASGTEIMQGRPAQVARGLNTIAGRIVSNQDALAEYGIIVQDVNGNLKSTYDVLAELKPKWDAMTDAQRVALGETLAGTNQYKVLSSVLQNFDSAVTATTTAMNSAGSAAAENDRYMESINAHVQNLKATFQDFARNVFNEDFVKRILDTANAFLEFVNTPFGQAATRITLLSAALFGLGGILKGYWKYFVEGTAIAKSIRALLDVSSLSGAGITGMEKFGAGLAKVGVGLKAIGPYVAIFAALAVAIKLGNKNLDDYNATTEKTAKIQEEISGTQSEYDELIKKTGELTDEEKKRLEVLKELREEQERELDAAKQAQWAAWNKIHGTGAKTVVGGAEGVGGGLGVGAVKTERADVVALKNYNAELAKIQEQYQSGSISAGAYYSALEKLNGAREESVEVIREAINAGYDVSDQQRQLVDAYDRVQGILGVTSSKTKDYVSGLISEAQQAGNTGKALYDLVAAQIRVSNTGLNFSQQIVALQQLGYQAGLTAQQVAAATGMLGNYQDQRNIERTISGLMQTRGMTRKQAEAKVYSDIQSSLWKKISSVNADAFTSTSAAVPTPSTSSADAEKARKAQLKTLQSERDQIQDTIDAINEKYDAEIEALEKVNDELEDEIELQQILEEMAKAKSSKKMVYKDGQFQYVEDIDAVAAAQTKLDEYNRKKILKDQKAAIESRRQMELAAYQERRNLLDKEIKTLQNYSSDIYNEYDNMLNNLQSQLDRKKELVDEWSNATPTTPGGTTGGSTGGSSSGGTHSPTSPTPSQIKQAEKIASAYPSQAYNTNHNGRYNTAETKELQAFYGTAADGIWGVNSYTAAGNRNISTAWSLYQKIKNSYSSFDAFKQAGGYALGTLRASGGMHMVGEQGPELRVLNQGDGVIPAKQTQRLWQFANDPAKFLNNVSNGGSRSEIINVGNVTLPNVTDAEGFVAGLKNMALQRAYARK